MSPSRLALFASLALTATAVLIPPSMVAAELGNTALDTLAISPSIRTVAVECPDCAVASLNGETLKWAGDAGNAFLLDFHVGARKDSLEIDGVQLYPPSFAMAEQPFHVMQVSAKPEDVLRLRVTGYTFHFNTAETMSEDGVELLPMTLQITSVESMPVDPPAVTINLLKFPTGEVTIASFGAANAVVTPVAQGDCKQLPLLCKARTALADRLERLKQMGKGRGGCRKRPHGHHNPMSGETFHGKPPHRFRPGAHHHPHMDHHGHHHGHRHRMHMFLHRAFFTVLVPVLVGIFAGTLTYIFGMAMGCLIAVAMAWLRGQSYELVALEEDVEASIEASIEEPSEKQNYAELLAYEAPPVYKDAPDKDAEETK